VVTLRVNAETMRTVLALALAATLLRAAAAAPGACLGAPQPPLPASQRPPIVLIPPLEGSWLIVELRNASVPKGCPSTAGPAQVCGDARAGCRCRCRCRCR